MLDKDKYGIESGGDIAAFLLGFALGASLDAVTNVAGFAEPFTFGGAIGAGTLAIKKVIFDIRRNRDKEKLIAKAQHLQRIIDHKKGIPDTPEDEILDLLNELGDIEKHVSTL